MTQKTSKQLRDIIKVSEEQLCLYSRHTKTAFVAEYALQAAKDELDKLVNGAPDYNQIPEHLRSQK